MPAISSSSPGKIILFGEHAVVYGSYAIAIPVNQVHSKATITPLVKSPPGEVEVVAPDIGIHSKLNDLDEVDPLAVAIKLSLARLGLTTHPPFLIRITSDIPIAAGMGSGSSVSCSIAMAVSTFLGHPFTSEDVSGIAFEVEKLHHGNPSGVDNTVIAFNQPVYFKRPFFKQVIKAGKVLHFLIADTGIKSQTAEVVNAVRTSRESDPIRIKNLLEAIDTIVVNGRNAIENGKDELIGNLMDENHLLLQNLGVSHPTLDYLVTVARESGSLGAKLSGAGRGGNIIALVPQTLFSLVKANLMVAGAVRVIQTSLQPAYDNKKSVK